MLSKQKINALKKAGINKPVRASMAATAARLPLSLVCAVLMQETGGGTMEWGHDPTIFVGGYDKKNKKNWGSIVTKAAYQEYKRQRGSRGQGGMQGVGDMQLTYYSYQDQADKLGGCYKSLPNMIVGCRLLASNIRRYGLRAGIAAYNGSGPAAQAYAESVLNHRKVFIKILGK